MAAKVRLRPLEILKATLFFCVLSVVTNLIGGGVTNAEDFRYLTMADHRQTQVKLSLVQHTESMVTLHREDNERLIQLPIGQLSQADPQYLRLTVESKSTNAQSGQRAAAASSANWPRFLGPYGTGVSSQTGLAAKWSETKNVAWKTKLPGPGSSSPIVWGDRVYLTCYTGYGISSTNPGDKSNLVRHLVCVDRRGGTVLWQRSQAAAATDGDFAGFLVHHGYASHTPVADERGVYVYFATGGVAAYTHDGELRWRQDIGFHGGGFGSACSPILHDGLLLVNAMNESNWSQGEILGVFAFEKDTGKEKWRFQWAGGLCQLTIVGSQERQTIVLGRERSPTRGYDPGTGVMLWECNTELGNYNPMPTSGEGIVFATNQNHTAAIRLGGQGDVTETHKLWEINKGSYVAAPIYFGGHLYIANEDGGIVYCIDAKTGRVVYEERLPSLGAVWASPVIADGKLYLVSRFHGTYVLAAKPQFELLAHNKIADDDSQFHGTPAISGVRLFLRSDNFLYCISEE